MEYSSNTAVKASAHMLATSPNLPPGAQPISEVGAMLNILEMNCSDLEQAFDSLVHALAPALPHDVLSEPVGDEKWEAAHSPLGATLQTSNIRLSRLVSAIHNVRQDLHI